jgi:hypothetical protein
LIEETGWVIEQDSTGGGLLYLTLKDGQIGWSLNNQDAFRMARREDAVAFSNVFLGGTGRFADHMWYCP